jgi:hypothetical protein
MMRTRLVMMLFSGLTLAAFASSPADDREAIAVRVKLGFSYLSKAQMQELWRLVDNYAAAEAFLRQCGSPSHVDRRMMLAARDCIDQGALNRVAAYFRGKVLRLIGAIRIEHGNRHDPIGRRQAGPLAASGEAAPVPPLVAQRRAGAN